MDSVKVIKVKETSQLDLAFQIRREVFVDEQNVPEEEEIDEFEDSCSHFVAYVDSNPAGAARWRKTDNGIKLERFAVRKDYRGRGVGSALVSAVLKDIQENESSSDKMLYLHAQLGAIPLYSKFGFVKVGEMFEECDIQHYKMIKEKVQ